MATKDPKDMDDDELMEEIKKVVKADQIADIGKKSPIIKTALERKLGRGSKN